MDARDLLAWNVKKLRVERGLSQERLALDANLERPAISHIEGKHVSVGIDVVGQIAVALGVTIERLFAMPAEGEPEPVNLKRGRPPSTHR